MARIKVEVNKDELQKVINELESKETFNNLSTLYKAVENTEWAKSQQPKPLTASVVYLRIREFGIVCKTQPGKRLGGDKPTDQVTEQVTEPLVPHKKMAAFGETFSKMRKFVPSRFLPLIDRAEKGSKVACIKLKCLDCSGYDVKEIKYCVVDACSLFPIRPYQVKEDDSEEEVEDAIPEGEHAE